MKWRVIDSGINNAAINMAMDEAILIAHGAGEVPPTLRFYGWRPAAISLGYFQKAAKELNLDECKVRGIDVVRRLTGGRVVLHDAELTYSIIVREDYLPVPKTITASYHYFSEGLLAGLQQMGLEARMNMPSACRQSKKQYMSSACFDTMVHYEISVKGRKMVGSAQVRKDGIILQHGSVLLKFRAEDVVSLLRIPSQDMYNKMVEMLSHRAISVEEALGRSVSWREMCDVMSQAFGPALGVKTESLGFTEKELAMSCELAEAKYSQDTWNRMG